MGDKARCYIITTVNISCVNSLVLTAGVRLHV